MKKQIETVTVTLTVKLPTQYHKFLEALGQLVEKTPEEILTGEVYCTLQSFINGGHFEAWIEEAQQKNQDLEKLVEQLLE